MLPFSNSLVSDPNPPLARAVDAAVPVPVDALTNAAAKTAAHAVATVAVAAVADVTPEVPVAGTNCPHRLKWMFFASTATAP